MRNLLQAFLAVALVTAVGGCLELSQKATINPDGSAKVLVEVTQPGNLPGMMGGGANAPDPKELAKAAVQKLMAESKGVDAWSDITFEMTKEQKVHFVGTAYVPDITKFKANEGAENQISWAKDDKGGMVLTLKVDKDKDGPPAKPAEMTDAQVAEQVKKAQAEYQQMKPMMQMMLGGLKFDMVYILPGKLEDVSGFKKTEDGKGVQLTIDGKKLMEVMDAQMADEKAIAASVKAGRQPSEPDPDQMMEKLTGAKGPLSARVSDAKAQFDYKAEMEKAKAAQPEMMKKLGLDKPVEPKAIGGGAD